MFLDYPDFGIWKRGHLFYRNICSSGAFCFPGILNIIMEDGGWCSQAVDVDSRTSVGLCFLNNIQATGKGGKKDLPKHTANQYS